MKVKHGFIIFMVKITKVKIYKFKVHVKFSYLLSKFPKYCSSTSLCAPQSRPESYA